MKTYLNKYMALDKRGNIISREIEHKLKEIIDREFLEGYNPFELLGIINDTASLMLSEKKLRHGVKLFKEEKKAKSTDHICIDDGGFGVMFGNCTICGKEL